ncbi:hypothetical protein ACP70R_026386 [Stipagrostis hirtigluma subsp. patula]
MAMVRSALVRASRRLSGSSAAPSVMCRRGPEILQAPPLPSLRPAAALMPRPGPAVQMRTFTSPAAVQAACTCRIPNLQGRQHFPVNSKGTEGMKCADQKRLLSSERRLNDATLMELAREAVKRLKAWLNGSFDPRHEFMAVTFIGVTSVVSTAVTYHRLGSHRKDPDI